MILLLNFYSAFSSAVSCDDLQNIKENMALLLRHFMHSLPPEGGDGCVYEHCTYYVFSGKGVSTFCRICFVFAGRHAPLS